jgi:uncharacterized membrane protein
VLNIVLGVASEAQDASLAFAVSVFSLFVGYYVQLGLMRLSLNIVDGKSASVRQLFDEYSLVLRYIGASIVYGVIILAGLLLLIVPGIIWSIKYSQYGFLMLDKNLGIMESISMSGKITNGAKMELLWIGIIVGLLMFVSIIPLGLGLIATIPMSVLVGPLLYRRLMVRHEGQGTADISSASAVPEPPKPTDAETPAPFVPPEQEKL